jgi:Uma2 family endonuclease
LFASIDGLSGAKEKLKLKNDDMTTATAINYYEIVSRLPAGSELILREQTWEDYEEILEDVGEASGLRISFDGENLKIMTLSTKHEKYVRLMEMLITALSLKTRKKILHFGSATMKSSRSERGSEPDCCFYVQNAEQVAHLDTIDFTRDAPPDIVVEIDIYHASTEKFEIYSKLQVPEFWLYDGKKLKIYQLFNEVYEEIEKSTALSILTAEILTDFLNRLETSDQYEILLEFEKWLDEQK